MVTNTAGGPVEGVDVDFALDTTVGNIELTPASATSGGNGLVSTIVKSGTVATSVTVTASVVTPTGITPATSSSLVISTGIPDQNSFSMSTTCNNIEGQNIDGTEVDVVVRAADRYNNPVRDGTAISFTSEGGSIGPSCLSIGGACSVKFRSQAPRTGTSGLSGTNDRRYTILATAIGEESFEDRNGDGRYTGSTPESFVDLGEAFLDQDEDGVRDADEEFVDFDNDGVFDATTPGFTGLLCSGVGCDTSASSLSVRDSLVIVMSSSAADISLNPTAAELSSGPVTILVTVADTVGQSMSGGTTIEASTSFGTIAGAASFTQACTSFNGPTVYAFTVEAPEGQEDPASGTFVVTVTSPSGLISQASAPVTFIPGAPTPPPPGTLGDISYLSAAPTTIGLRDSGLQETSTVRFRLRNTEQQPIAGETVNFSLSTTVGGITFTPASAVSDDAGIVETVVRAGNVPTSVVVRAVSDSNPAIKTVSAELTISAGRPDQNSFTLSSTVLNLEGHDYNGETATITASLSDRFENPVPDGTAVNFRTEGGTIEPSCTTVGGSCSVTFTSTNPRVANHRYTIFATAIGEESFTDLNGNGAFDMGEPFSDLAEAYLDRDEGATPRVGNRDAVAGTVDRDGGSEEFVDFDSNGSFTPGDALFTGPICNTGCSPANSLSVSDSLVLVMSNSEAFITTNPPGPTITLMGLGGLTPVNITVADGMLSAQSMVAGTTIVAEIINDNETIPVATFFGLSEFTQMDTNADSPTTYRVRLRHGAAAATGTLRIVVTTPKGVVTELEVALETVP